VKNLDNEIKNILADKLANHESPVSADMWSAVQAKMAAQAAASGAAGTAVKAGLSKMWWAAIVAAATVVGAAVYLAIQPEAKNVNVTEQTHERVATTEKLNSEPQKNAGSVENNEIAANAAKVEQNASAAIISGAKEISTVLPTTHETNAVNNNPAETAGQLEISDVKEASVSANPTNESSPPANANNQIAPQENLNAGFKAVVVSPSDLKFSFIPQNGKAAHYEWSFGDGETSAEMSPQHTYTTEGKYTVKLTVTNEAGNAQAQSMEVSALRPAELFIPNVFTPNGDGKNDEFLIQVKNASAVLTKIVILDSTGRIFESDGTTMWNGKLPNGELAPAGTYTYLVRALGNNQEILEKSGSVSLRR
jgi:gliding motility-associated-like protein